MLLPLPISPPTAIRNGRSSGEPENERASPKKWRASSRFEARHRERRRRIDRHECRDLAAHPGPIGEVEIEDAVEAEVVARLREAGDETRRQIGTARGFELHRKKGQLGRRVSAAEALRELDAVDDHGLRRTVFRGKKVDVLQAKIAVPLAHALLRDALRESRRFPRQLAPLKGLHLVEGLLVEKLPDERRDLGEVLVQVPAERGERAEVGSRPGGPQKAGQPLGDQLQRPRVEAPLLQERGRARRVGQPPHVDRPIDDRARRRPSAWPWEVRRTGSTPR